MEIGLDYMQMRSSAQYYGLRWAGIALVLVGILLAAVGIAYYGHFYWLRATVNDYAAQRPDATRLAADAPTDSEGSAVSAYSLPSAAYAGAVEQLGFTVLPDDAGWPIGSHAPAERLVIPSLGIDWKLDEGVVTGGAIANSAVNAAPRNDAADPGNYQAVSANPGERGAMWFFGPVGKGAGSFDRLTEAAELLNSGEDVLLFTSSDSGGYLYAATHTEVFPASELHLNSSGRATIHLVAPVPSGVYDHFLVLSGQLAGVK